MSAPNRRGRRRLAGQREPSLVARYIERAGTSGIGRCRSKTCDTPRPRRGYGADVPLANRSLRASVFETETDILRGYAEGWQPDTAGHPAAGMRSERADSPEPG